MSSPAHAHENTRTLARTFSHTSLTVGRVSERVSGKRERERERERSERVGTQEERSERKCNSRRDNEEEEEECMEPHISAALYHTCMAEVWWEHVCVSMRSPSPLSHSFSRLLLLLLLSH